MKINVDVASVSCKFYEILQNQDVLQKQKYRLASMYSEWGYPKVKIPRINIKFSTFYIFI